VPDCPTCGRTFDSRRGLGVHHSRTHNERLPNRTCDYCGERFYSEYQKRYCSDACLDASGSYAGPNNPNYSGGKERTSCVSCGDSFEYYPSEKPGKYCPDCVETVEWRSTPDVDAEANPRWKGGKVELECDECGEEVRRFPADLTGEHAFCSPDCQADWLSEAFTGEGHPNWKGGDVGPYGPGWNRVRREALKRDGYACVVCGADRIEIGRNPDVHHLIPVRSFAASDDHDVSDAHYLDNVVSLCVDCHRKADAGLIRSDRLRSVADTDGSD